jgi:DNA (cytosine-5)-methyltransferase 1
MKHTHSGSDLVLSLFSGAGGFSYGFSQAGLKPVCGADVNKDACESYMANVGSPCHHLDLSTVEPSHFKSQLGGKEPFIVIGGPPCQGFSTAGMRNIDDPRNRLIFNYIRLVAEIRPRWFIFENVEGLLTSGGGDAIFALVKQFLGIGYSVRVEKKNLAAYGVPQTRKRVLIIGNRVGINFAFPTEQFSYDSGKAKKATMKPFAPTLNEAVAGLGEPGRGRGEAIAYTSPSPENEYDARMRVGNMTEGATEHFHTTTEKDAERFALLQPGQTMKDLPEDLWHDSFKRRAFRRVMDGTPTEKRGGAPSGIKRLRGNLQSLTITGAATREFIHPSENRALTIRECARIQTFPDCYEFKGNAASVTQQIGNAVPPLAASVIAKHLMDIDGAFGSATQALKTDSKPRLLGFLLTESLGKSEALRKTETKLITLQQPTLDFL